MHSARWQHIGSVFFNSVGTHLPSHAARQAILRIWGAKIGQKTSILRGTTVLGIAKLNIGDHCSIGFRVLLDARGGLRIRDNVVIASDTHFITGTHVIDSDDFAADLQPIEVGRNVWIASRSTVLPGVSLGRGAVVGACSLVREDVPDMTIVAGVPATPRGTRHSSLEYQPFYRPWGF